MKWFFFLVVCPTTSMDFCEPKFNDFAYETRAQCEEALKSEVDAYTSEDTLVLQASCREKNAKKKPEESKKP